MRLLPLSNRGRWFAATLLYVVVTLAYARPLLPVIGSALPNDVGDPGLNSWILWWNAQAVPLTERWWNGPIFFPVRGALALSETFLNLWPLSTPLQWAGASAVLTYNLMYLLSFPTAALAAHALALRLTASAEPSRGGRHDAGLIAGFAYGFAPYRAAQMPHLQALWSCWMPLGLLALHRYLETRKPRDLIVFGVCWMMNGLATGYYLFFFTVLVALWVIWFARARRDWLAIGLTAALATLPLAPLLAGYRHYQSAFGVARTMGEVEFFSADLSAIWAAHPYVWPHLWTIEPRAEGELYPGAMVLALAIVGGVVAWRRSPSRRPYRLQPWLFGLAGLGAAVALYSWIASPSPFTLLGVRVSLTNPLKTLFISVSVAVLAACWNARIVDAWRRRSAFLFYAIAAALMFVFALGPQARLLGKTFWAQAPYYWLMQLPGGHAFRVPARFAMLFSLCLAMAAVLAFVRLFRKAPALTDADVGSGFSRTVHGPTKVGPYVRQAVCLAVALEGFVARMEAAPVPRPVDFGGLDRGAVVLELPIVDVFTDTAAMLRATQAGYTLVNGFSGYYPPHYAILSEGVASFDRSVLAALQEFGSLMVFVHKERDPEDHYLEFVADVPGAHRVLTSSDGTLYRLPERPQSQPARAPSLAIGSVTASINRGDVPRMMDGDVRTRWDTGRHQEPGDEVRITLGRPGVVRTIELHLGPFAADYPRRLRVAAVTEEGSRIIWEGKTAGLALMSALTDPLRMPLTIDLAPPVRAGELVLTVVDGHETNAWSIAEVKVSGE